MCLFKNVPSLLKSNQINFHHLWWHESISNKRRHKLRTLINNFIKKPDRKFIFFIFNHRKSQSFSSLSFLVRFFIHLWQGIHWEKKAKKNLTSIMRTIFICNKLFGNLHLLFFTRFSWCLHSHHYCCCCCFVVYLLATSQTMIKMNHYS